MNNISKILEAISAEGKAEVDKIIEAGNKNAEDVRKLYNEEAAMEEAQILKKAEKEVGEVSQRGISQAGIESRNIKLTARRQSLEKAFVLAMDKLTQLSDDEKLAFYGKLIKACDVKQEITVVLNDADRKAFGEKLAAAVSEGQNVKVSLAETAGNFSGGLIVQEGDVETNCTFEALMKDTKKEMESEIAAMLFA